MTERYGKMRLEHIDILNCRRKFLAFYYLENPDVDAAVTARPLPQPDHPQMLTSSNRATHVERITPQRVLFHVDFRGIWRYKDLIPLLIRRDFVGEFSQTILGPTWFLLHPLMQSVVFSLVFGSLAKISTEGASPFLFYNAGLVLWTYFTMTTTFVSNSFISNAGLFGKVYFPRLIVPIATSLFRLIGLGINFALFLFFMAFFALRGTAVTPNLWVLAAPLVIFQVVLLAFGMGTLVSSLTTRFRDMVQAIGYFFAIWMYATPIIYPLSQVPEKWKWLFFLNPMTSPIEIFRYGFLGSGSVNYTLWATNVATTLVILFIGIIAFNYTEKTVVDTV